MVISRNISLGSDNFSWLGEGETQTLIKALGENACRFVGGVVRDSLLGKTILDIDVATSLKPEEVLTALKKAGIKAIPTGLKHGTVTAVFTGRAFELTTLRHDVKTYGRHAQVAFHDDWQADAARRDFTINALYLDPDKTLYDYFDGEADLKAGRVRFIGNAENRIKEDALRILRFFRFHAWYGKDDLDTEGLQAISKTLGLLKNLSSERISKEFLKTLEAPDPITVLKTMKKARVLSAIFKGRTLNLSNLIELIFTETKLSQVSASRRLAALAVKDKKQATSVGEIFKLSGKQLKRLTAMVDRPLPKNVSEKTAAREIYITSKASFIDRLILKGGNVSELKSLIKFTEDFETPIFPIGGADLEKQGIEPGVEMGKILQKLEETWVESNFILSATDLLKKLN